MNFNIINSINGNIVFDIDFTDVEKVERYSTVQFNVNNFLERIKVEEEINLENFKAFISGNGSISAIKSGYIQVTCLSALTMDEVSDELDIVCEAFRKLKDKHCEIIFVY